MGLALLSVMAVGCDRGETRAAGPSAAAANASGDRSGTHADGELANATETANATGNAGATGTSSAAREGAPVDPRTRGEALPEPQHLDAIDLVAGVKRIRAEVARTSEQRQRGLMGRLDVGGDTGMLFVWPRKSYRRFWMKDTPSPLTLAFLDDDGRIEQIEDLVPFDLHDTPSNEAARYVLEMPRGWFAANGLKPGDAIYGLDHAGPAED